MKASDHASTLRDGVQQAYSEAATAPQEKHPFPVGRDFAENRVSRRIQVEDAINQRDINRLIRQRQAFAIRMTIGDMRERHCACSLTRPRQHRRAEVHADYAPG